MPALEPMPGVGDALGYLSGDWPRSAHPDPKFEGLRLEAISPKERTYLGRQLGVDEPELLYPLGWGEWAPVVYPYYPPPIGTQEVVGRR